MKSHVNALWLLFISNVIVLVPEWNWLTNIITLAGGIISIIALFKLADRNDRLTLARNYQLWTFALLTVIPIVAVLIFRSGIASIALVVSMLAGVGFSIASEYNLLNGLADMALEMERTAHAQRLRFIFKIKMTLVIAGLLKLIKDATIDLVLYGLGIVAAVYLLFLLYRSIKIEQALVAGKTPQRE